MLIACLFLLQCFADSQSAIRFAYVDDSNPASLRIVDSDAENRSNYEGIRRCFPLKLMHAVYLGNIIPVLIPTLNLHNFGIR